MLCTYLLLYYKSEKFQRFFETKKTGVIFPFWQDLIEQSEKITVKGLLIFGLDIVIL